MTRALALGSIGLLVAIPSVVHPTPGSAVISVIAGALGAVGVLLRVPALVTAGASLTLIQYAFTLLITNPPARVLIAVGLGVTLVLALDVSEFCLRFHGATVDASAWRRQTRHWLASVALGGLAASALGAAASLVSLGAPPTVPPLIAAVGALLTVVGVAGAVWRRSH